MSRIQTLRAPQESLVPAEPLLARFAEHDEFRTTLFAFGVQVMGGPSEWTTVGTSRTPQTGHATTLAQTTTRCRPKA